MNERELRALIAEGETMTVEFKSDAKLLSDSDLIATVTCLANGRGGTLLIGVEDDGRVTGLHPRHHSTPAALAAFIANRTVPPLTVGVEFVTLPEGVVAVLEVSASRQPISTSEGRLVTRFLDVHSRPGCRPLYAYELTNWLAERGQVDATALVVPDATWEDLDPLEFARLRRMVRENRGDAALLALSDREIARALRLVREEGDRLTPTLAGLLLVGQEPVLTDCVPAHEVAFQVLRGTEVTVNEFRRWPLLRVHEWLMESVNVRNEEQELMLGGMRVGVPRYDPTGLREAVNNALIHRDYTSLGAVHVQLHDTHVRISNPGGFVTGVHSGNLLVVEPRPRNLCLADAFKRVGLVERTGRGIEAIYQGQLRNGRRPPDYTLSTASSVSVELYTGPADLDFVRMAVLTGRRLKRTLAVDELLALWATWHTLVVTVTELAAQWQRSAALARSRAQTLVQEALLEPATNGYRLAAGLRERAAVQVDPEEAILDYVRTHGRITRREAIAVTGLDEEPTRYHLRLLKEKGALELFGSGRGAYYRLPGTEKNGE